MMPRNYVSCCVLLFGTLTFAHSPSAVAAEANRPNVIVVITDDQGYGDLGCHGNTMINTPNLDQLYEQSVRFTDYHVDPTCAPTRSALMTGRYSTRTGVWHTIMGRSIVHRDETMLPELFVDAGYRTGMFGKWHLGDNYPFRPHDRGFEMALYHGGGGVGQGPDYWGNDYFDDTYFRNGEPEAQKGYCTDVWFDEALAFIDKNQDEPFFLYVATNAPHSPYNVDERYSKPYVEAGVPQPMANFYGMITNIDENMGRLTKKLDELQISDDTILIFTTDNGTAAGHASREEQKGKWNGFSGGMRGKKGSEYEGGHRVPLFIRWPGEVAAGKDVDTLTAHIDLLPTLAEFCNLTVPSEVKLDGKSLAELAMKPGAEWKERTLFVHSQRIPQPEKWRKSAVMTERWRLINGEELYDLEADPGQQKNIAGEKPEVVAQLRKEYDAWWESISTRFDEYVRIPLGEEGSPVQHLMSHDWHIEGGASQIPWHQANVRRDQRAEGFWAVEVKRPGRYRFELRVRPEHVEHPIPEQTATVTIGDATATTDIAEGATAAVIEMQLTPGEYPLQTTLAAPGKKPRGAYFVDVHYLGE